MSELAFRAHCQGFEVANAANVPPAKSQAREPSWVPRADGDAMGSGRVVAPAEKGPEAADRQAGLEARRSLTASRGAERAGRLSRTDEVRQVLGSGHRRRLRFVEVAWRRREAGHLRLGLIVPKFQSTAVARNRLRRRLRELARRLASEAGPLDVVIRARRSAYGASFAELRAEVATWLAELGASG